MAGERRPPGHLLKEVSKRGQVRFCRTLESLATTQLTNRGSLQTVLAGDEAGSMRNGSQRLRRLDHWSHCIRWSHWRPISTDQRAALSELCFLMRARFSSLRLAHAFSDTLSNSLLGGAWYLPHTRSPTLVVAHYLRSVIGIYRPHCRDWCWLLRIRCARCSSLRAPGMRLSTGVPVSCEHDTPALLPTKPPFFPLAACYRGFSLTRKFTLLGPNRRPRPRG